MKILLINKYHFVKGGAERHFFDLKRLLESHGHTVVVFCMRHPDNLPSPQEKYFVSRVDFERVRFNWQGLRAVGRMLYSFEARRKLAQLIQDERPDIAHLHNIYHQISPSILPVLKKYRIPVVQTLHDYSLISPNYMLFHDGAICERVKEGNYFRAVSHRCVKQSRTASFAAAVEMFLHKKLKLYENNIDLFIAPSEFLKAKVLEWDTRVKRIETLPYFISKSVPLPETVSGEYLLFFGRLSEEKGVDLLLRAMAGVDLPLKIIGTGPREQVLKTLADSLHLRQVEWLGYRTAGELPRYIQNARAVIVPSLWYENCPLVILEAYQQGRPVIGSDIGGVRENVIDGRTGKLFAAGDAGALLGILKTVAADPDPARTLGQGISAQLERYDPERFYARLMELYDSVR